MVRVLKYPVRHYVRISNDDDKSLQKIAKRSGVKPSVLLRSYVIEGIKNDINKEGSK